MLNRFLSILILLSLFQSAWAGVTGVDGLMREAAGVLSLGAETDSSPCHHSMSSVPDVNAAESPQPPCCEDAQDDHHGYCQHSCHQPLPVGSAIPAALVIISAPSVTVDFNLIPPQPLPALPSLPERPPSIA